MTRTSPPFRLRSRIVMWSFLPTTLILLAVAITILFSYRRVTEDLVVGRNQQLTRLSARQLASDLTVQAGELSTLAHGAGLTGGDPERQEATLRAAANPLLVYDGGALVLDPAGRVVAADPSRSDLLGQDWSARTFFRQLIHGAEPVFSDIMPLDGAAEGPGVGVAVSLRDAEGVFRGVLVGLFRLGPDTQGALYGVIVKQRLGATGSAYLVDGTGRIIYHPVETLIGQDAREQPAVQRVLAGQAGHLRGAGLVGGDVLASYAPVPGTPWGLVHEEDWSSLLTASLGYGGFLFGLLGLGVLIPAVVVAVGVRRITHPVAQLLAGAREIADGQYGRTITLSTGDELEGLVAQFNRMSLSLQESYASLEARVAARTKELATLNAIAALASDSLYLEETLGAVLRETLETLGMESGLAYRLEEGDAAAPRLRLIVHRGVPEDLVSPLASRPLAEGPFGRVAESGEPLVWRGQDHPDAALRAWLEREGVSQIVCLPLMAKGRMVGGLALAAHEARPVTPEELALLGAIGRQVGVAVENAHLYHQARESATLAERSRLARELHDSVTQSLYSVTLFAEAAATLLAAGDQVTAAEHLAELRDTAQEALREMRLLIFELRLPAIEEQGLSGVLQERLQAVEARGGIQSALHVTGEERLPLDVQEELYHMAQEILNNVLKHARAGRVDVSLDYTPDGACLAVQDDGVGFDPARLRPGGMGLDGLRERAARLGASLDLKSTPGRGTRITVRLARPAGNETVQTTEVRTDGDG